MKKTGIRTVQLHSLSYNEIKYLRWIEGFQRNPFERSMKVIRAVGLSEESLEGGMEYQIFKSKKRGNRRFCKNHAMHYYFDYQVEGKSGGTGRQIPIKMVLEAIKIAKNVNSNVEIFLAGGMNSERISK